MSEHIRAERLRSRLLGIMDGFNAGASVDVKEQEEEISKLESSVAMLRQERDRLQEALTVLSGCLPNRIFVYGSYGESWTDFEAQAGDEYEIVDFGEILNGNGAR